MFAQLCRDDTPMVRKAASAALGGFGSVVDPESANSELVPLFLALAQDRQDSVRIHTIDNAVALAKLVPREVVSTQILSTVFDTARDGSWRVRWSVANRFPEICEVVSPETVNTSMCDCFSALLEDSEAEVRTSATSKVRCRTLACCCVVRRLTLTVEQCLCRRLECRSFSSRSESLRRLCLRSRRLREICPTTSALRWRLSS